jgi:hypothetical protein
MLGGAMIARLDSKLLQESKTSVSAAPPDQTPELFALPDEPSGKPRIQHDPQSDRPPLRLATHFYRHNPYPPLGILPT